MLDMTARAEQLFESGRYDDALAEFEQSAAGYRQQVGRDPYRFDLLLAGELNNVGMCLGKLRRYEQALTVFEEAAAIWERYWQTDKDLSPFYAATLASLASVLAELGRYRQAVEITERLVPLRRAATEPGPLQIDPELANGLRLFARARTLAGLDLERALPAATEALTIYRHLAEVSPQAFTGELHLAYEIFAAALEAVGRTADAAEVRDWISRN